MAFKTFAPGVLTSSDVNTFLMRQAVITCTSSTRPSSPSEGMTIYETDTDAVAIYTGSAWRYRGHYESFTPTIASASTGWAIGNGTINGNYTLIDDLAIGRIRIGFGSTSTFGASGLDIDMPVNAANIFYEVVGVGDALDASAGNGYQINVNHTSQTFRLNLRSTSLSWTTDETVTSTRPFTWTNGDIIGFTFFYQAA